MSAWVSQMRTRVATTGHSLVNTLNTATTSSGSTIEGDLGGDMDNQTHGSESSAVNESMMKHYSNVNGTGNDNKDSSSSNNDGDANGLHDDRVGEDRDDSHNSMSSQASSLLGGISRRFSWMGEAVKNQVGGSVGSGNWFGQKTGAVPPPMGEVSPTTNLYRRHPTKSGASDESTSPTQGKEYSSNNSASNAPSFVIEEEEKKSPAHRIIKSEEEKKIEMANYVLSGLKKGDHIEISKENLPGAMLFPCKKVKMVEASGASASNNVSTNNSPTSGLDGEKDAAEVNEFALNTSSEFNFSKAILVHRFLVVSRERFIVLDSAGNGVGSEATVKSNHHLTQLIKMTYKKKNPNMVSLFVSKGSTNLGESATDGKTGGDVEMKEKKYKLSKPREFIEALQTNMQRFK